MIACFISTTTILANNKYPACKGMSTPDRVFVGVSNMPRTTDRTIETANRPYLNNTTVTADVQVEDDISVSQIVLVIFALVMSIFIICVNSVTILVVRRTPGLHTLSNIYVVSLAATDVIVGLGLIPLSMFYIPSIRRQYFDDNMELCVLVLGVNLGMAVMSTIHMVLVAVDRYMYIIRPYFYQNVVSSKIVYIIIACTWSFGVVYALLPQVIHNQATGDGTCDITLVMPVEYLFYANVSIYTASVVTSVIMYSQILLTAYRQRKVIQSKAIVVQPTPSSNVFTTNMCQKEDTEAPNWKSQPVTAKHQEFGKQEHSLEPKQSNSVSLPGKKPTYRMKSVKFFMTVFGVYFICLTPTVMCMGIDYYWPLPRFLYNMFNLLGLLNSGMNFIIYFALNVRFRIALLKLFRYPRVVNLMKATDASFLDN